MDIEGDGGLDSVWFRLLEGDRAGLCDECSDTFIQEGDGGADGWMAGEWKLGSGDEDVNATGGLVLGVDVRVLLMDEDCLAEVELACNGLLLFLCRVWLRASRNCDDGQWVALEPCRCKDI